MALNAAAVFEVRAAGADTNGGGWKAGATGVDRSQQDSPQATLTTAATVHTATTQINVPAGEFTVSAADVGNHFQVNSGTATLGVYEIAAVDVPNNRWTVDRAVGTAGQTCAGGMGGAFASPGKASEVATVPGMTVHVKSGNYVMSASASVSGGRFSTTARIQLIGYGSARGDDGTKPRFLANANSMACVTLSGTGAEVRNVEAANNAAFTSVTGFALGANIQGILCKATGIATGFSAGMLRRCEASGCATGFSGASGAWCTSSGHTTAGFSGAGDGLYHCVARGGTASGFAMAANATKLYHCLAYANTGASTDGFNLNTSFGPMAVVNCLGVSNERSNFRENGTGVNHHHLVSCATYGSVGDSLSGATSEGMIALAADPFTNAAGLDFTLNSAAGGGALLKALGYPSAMPGLVGTNYPDVGAMQSQAGAAGGQQMVG